MLYLIGLGLIDEKDLTLRGLEIARQCDCYCELYTSKWESIGALEKLIGKKINLLQRSALEEDLQKFLQKAKEKDIALFVPGDPLAATTHIDLVLEAKKHGIPVKIIHNTSIFSAVSEAGLQLYKFGRTATVPFSKQLDAVKKAVKENKKSGLHTLLLLDIDAANKKYMSVNEAVSLLLENKIISEKEKLIVLCIKEKSVIVYDTAKNILSKNLPVPAVLIIPSKLHFREKEFLDLL